MVRGLKEMQKTHQALLRYLNLDILTSLNNFSEFIQDDGEFVIIPHRHSLDFLLIRLQGLSKILIRSVSTTRKAAKFFMGVLRCGNFHVRSILFLTTLARVWEHCRNICKNVVKDYNELIKFRLKIEEKPGFRLVEGDYDLPERLDKWLGDEYDDLIVNEVYGAKLLCGEGDLDRTLTSPACIDKYFASNLAQIDQTDEEMSTQEVHEELQQPVRSLLQPSAMEIEDLTPIARETAPTKEVELQQDGNSVNEKLKIADFVKNETYHRKNNDGKSLTVNKMSKKEWKEFANDIKNKILLMPENSLLEYAKDYLEDYEIEM